MNLLILTKLLKNKWTWIILAFVLLMAAVWVLLHLYQKEKADRIRWQNNYTSSTIIWQFGKDKLGRTQTRVKQLTLKQGELTSELYLKDSMLLSIVKELRLSDVKIRNLNRVIAMQLESGNSGTTVIVRDTIYTSTLTAALNSLTVADSNLYFKAGWTDPDSVNWIYSYNEEIIYWTEMKRTLYNKRGNKRFFLWRWMFPKRIPVTTIKSTNKNSKINATEITIL